MNRLVLIVVSMFVLLVAGAEKVQAQSFNGYQTIGTNTYSFSVIWQGKPMVGFSYTYRDFGTSFTDFQTEFRVPIDQGINAKEFSIVTGFYRPSQLKRNFIGTGLHMTWEHSASSQFKDKLSCSVTAIPSYVYSASINDGLYGTTGARISYAPVLWSKNKVDGATKHNVYLGLHVDSHHERSLGLSINPTYNIPLGSDEEKSLNGDFYFGQTYHLKR